MSLANWLLAAVRELHVLRAHEGGSSSSAMGGVGGAPLETPWHSGQRDPRAVPSEMLAPQFGPIQGALECGVPPSQELWREQLIQSPSSWATAPGTNQPDTSTAGGSLQNHRDASSWRTGILFAGPQGTHTAWVAL